MGLYDCMYLVTKERYEASLRPGSSGSHNVDGVGGDVQGSSITNIEVSGGGTVVVKDGEEVHRSGSGPAPPSAPGPPRPPMSQPRPPAAAKKRRGQSALARKAREQQQGPPPPPPPASGRPLPATGARFRQRDEPRGGAVAPRSSSSRARVLDELVKDRLATLQGVKFRGKMTQADVDRRIVHDLRDSYQLDADGDVEMSEPPASKGKKKKPPPADKYPADPRGKRYPRDVEMVLAPPTKTGRRKGPPGRYPASAVGKRGPEDDDGGYFEESLAKRGRHTGPPGVYPASKVGKRWLDSHEDYVPPPSQKRSRAKGPYPANPTGKRGRSDYGVVWQTPAKRQVARRKRPLDNPDEEFETFDFLNRPTASKVANMNRARVRAVGKFAGVKRGRAPSDDEDLLDEDGDGVMGDADDYLYDPPEGKYSRE